MVQAVTLEFEVLTPLFLGGADMAVPELRPPSLKGLMRFWYRAVAPDFMTSEPELFGGVGPGRGQSGVLLSIDGAVPRSGPGWQDFNAGRFSQGNGTHTRNGLIYLGFPFQMRKERQAIPPGHAFSLRCVLPRANGRNPDHDQKMRRAVIAACWLLGHFGGAGSRSRRGFGSLALRNWRPERGDWPELDALKLVANAAGPAEARAQLDQGLATLRGWFGAWDPSASAGQRPPHPHFGGAAHHKLLDSAVPRADWARGLAEMGAEMQKFRLRRAPDYQNVKDLVAKNRSLDAAPTRSAFGLPLKFQYSSVRGKPVTFVPFNDEKRLSFERHGSLLFLRPLAVGPSLFPLYLRLDGAVPGQDPPVAIRGESRSLRVAQTNAMDDFFDSLPAARR